MWSIIEIFPCHKSFKKLEHIDILNNRTKSDVVKKSNHEIFLPKLYIWLLNLFCGFNLVHNYLLSRFSSISSIKIE
jgi:hypothetical protein